MSRYALTALIVGFLAVIGQVDSTAAQPPVLDDAEPLTDLLTNLVDCTRFCDQCLERAKADCQAPCAYREFSCWRTNGDGCGCSWSCMCVGDPTIV